MKLGYRIVIPALAWMAVSCKPPGFINKAKYENKKVVNTCDSFKKELDELVASNEGLGRLTISEFDNSQFDARHLEPGQFELFGDTLYFRLANDVIYEKYLQKGVAVHVKAEYATPRHLKKFVANDEETDGNFDELIIDRKYYDAHKNPEFVYRMPVSKKLDGKEFGLSFSIVKYNKKGKLKKVFCNSQETPLNPFGAPCCTQEAWEKADLQSVIQAPELEVKDETYRYQGFSGTLDIIFPFNSVKMINREDLTRVIVEYVERYEKQGFKLKEIDFSGYASQEGKVDYNLRLSQRRCEAVNEDLRAHFSKNGRLNEIKIAFRGLGEDWDRFNALTESSSLAPAEKEKVLSISRGPGSPDDKEAMLKKLPYWKKITDEILAYCRHTFINFTFDYVSDKMYVERLNLKDKMLSEDLFNAATKTQIISKHKPGVDPNRGLKILNTLIDDNENKTANLFTMRSTYYYALADIRSAIKDVERALSLEPNNARLGVAALAYKTYDTKNFGLEERIRLLDEYNAMTDKFPADEILRANRLVVMDKVGLIGEALNEYKNPAGAVALNNRGVAKMKTNRLGEAEGDFIEAAKADAERYEPYYNLAILYAWRGLTNKAVSNLEQAVALRPEIKCELVNNPAFQKIKGHPKFQKFNC